MKDLFKFFFLCKPCEWVVAVEKGDLEKTTSRVMVMALWANDKCNSVGLVIGERDERIVYQLGSRERCTIN